MAPTISSRTPEGEPNRCPVCRKDLVLEPSSPFGDAPCPHCGVLLWFVARGSEVRYSEHAAAKPIRERVREFVADRLGVAENLIPDNLTRLDFDELGADSLDMVELVMELEEEFGDDWHGVIGPV